MQREDDRLAIGARDVALSISISIWKAQAQMRERWSRLDKVRASMLACPLCGTRAISGREEGNAFPGSTANLQIRRRQRATCVTYIEFPTILGNDNRPVSIYAI